MKTKFALLSVLFILSSVLGVSALYAQSNSATTTLNIKLNPIQTITVNHANVTLDYVTENDYKDGVFSNQKDHLTVFSTGGFVVKVSSAEKLVNGNSKEIAALDVKVTATNGTDNTKVNSVGAVALGGNTTLISSTTGGRALNYNVYYDNQAGTADRYLNVYDVKNTDNTFKTIVTYTITAL